MAWWTPQKLMAFDLYIKGKKPKEIVMDLTVSEQTVRKWMEHEKWTSLEAHHNNEVLRSLHNREIDLATQAIEVLGRIMDKGTSRDRTKLAAAKMILDRAAPVLKVQSHEDDGSGAGVKVIVVNNQLVSPERKQELLAFEEEMGYSTISPPKLVAGTVIDVTPEETSLSS